MLYGHFASHLEEMHMRHLKKGNTFRVFMGTGFSSLCTCLSADKPWSLEGNTPHVTQTSPLIGMLAHAKLCDCIQLLAGKESISKGNNISPRVW